MRVAAVSPKLTDFEFTLPSESVAQAPVTPRDHSRLLILDRASGQIQHKRFHQITSVLRAGDVLVLNATRVFPARLRGQKSTGGKIDVLLLRRETGARWQALVRGSAAIGAELIFPGELRGRLVDRLENGEGIIEFSKEDIRPYLNQHGEMPLPPYIHRPDKQAADTERYQTVYARQEGSIAAPTAGFHFTPELLAELKVRGVDIVEIVLHVGWGTFRPVRADNIAEHQMLPEFYEVSETAATQLQQARQERRRIVAVGTTAVRTLESIYDGAKGFLSGSGSTNVFIYPGYEFKAIDALITNFHLPHSTPLFLASAFYGQGTAREPFSLRAVYGEAIREGYRFYSYGDAMFIQ